jgi:hypothetical protein
MGCEMLLVLLAFLLCASAAFPDFPGLFVFKWRVHCGSQVLPGHATVPGNPGQALHSLFKQNIISKSTTVQQAIEKINSSCLKACNSTFIRACISHNSFRQTIDIKEQPVVGKIYWCGKCTARSRQITQNIARRKGAKLKKKVRVLKSGADKQNAYIKALKTAKNRITAKAAAQEAWILKNGMVRKNALSKEAESKVNPERAKCADINMTYKGTRGDAQGPGGATGTHQSWRYQSFALHVGIDCSPSENIEIEGS